jgi:Cu(I)/Ag(I) efflux system membrane fusion protein
MMRASAAIVLGLGVAAGAAGGYWYARPPAAAIASAAQSMAPATERTILYYRDPSGAPSWSAAPKKDASGRYYTPVYDDEEVSFDPAPKKAVAASGPRRVRYYRNPMGLPDTSPTPKKDNMGMDYIPVYEDEEKDDGKTVKVSLDKIQRSGVRTETVQVRPIVQPVRAVGTVKNDESRLTVVTLRASGYIEDLFVNATGQTVRKGQALFRLYSSEIQTAQSDLIVSAGIKPSASQGIGLHGSMQRLRNLDVPEARIEEVRTSGTNPRTIDWPSPAGGTVVYKGVITGQRVSAGMELYRIADLTHMWVIAEVAEADLAAIEVGTSALVTVPAYPVEPFEGRVTFIYPDIKPETRTARVRVDLPNPVGRLKIDMYADVVFQTGAGKEPAIAVPASAVIDSGTRQVVLVAKGEGRFEPRPVTLGRRGDGYVEVLSGIRKGEDVVTSATFLIDAESNLKAALQSFTQPEPTK